MGYLCLSNLGTKVPKLPPIRIYNVCFPTLITNYNKLSPIRFIYFIYNVCYL